MLGAPGSGGRVSCQRPSQARTTHPTKDHSAQQRAGRAAPLMSSPTSQSTNGFRLCTETVSSFH